MKYIKFNDENGFEHIVNVGYIAQLYVNNGAYGDFAYHVVVANGSASGDSAKDIFISKETYDKIAHNILR